MANRAVKLPTWLTMAMTYVIYHVLITMNFTFLSIKFKFQKYIETCKVFSDMWLSCRLGEHFVRWLAFCRAKSNTFAAMTCRLIDCIINFVLNSKRQAIRVSCMSCQLIWQFLMKVTHNEVFCKLRFLWLVIKTSCLAFKG